MAINFKKPEKKDFTPSKTLRDAVAKTEKTPADTKALIKAQRELEAAVEVLGQAMTASHAACDKMVKLDPRACKTEKPPAVPIPYPNFAKVEKEAKNTAQAAEKALKKVKVAQKNFEQVADKELKKLSTYQKSSGDADAGAAKKGLVTSKAKSKAYFIQWSMDVKAEGKNVTRLSDILTSNH